MSKVRISKSGKFSKLFPAPVAKRIREIADEYSNIKSITFTNESSSKVFYVGEGERYEGIFTNGESTGFETISANTVGGSGLSWRINDSFRMPEGVYLVRVSYYTRYFMDVIFIGPEALPAQRIR